MFKNNLIFISLLLLFSYCYSSETPPQLESTSPRSQDSPVALRKKINVQKVIDYPIPHVIARFCKDYEVLEEDAKIYERELKRYLILAAEYPDDHLSMLSSDVDNLWHTFLLFTKDYKKFCEDMFGSFIHHVPKVDIDQKFR